MLENNQKLEQDSKYNSAFYLVHRLFKEHLFNKSKKLVFVVLCMIVVSITTALNAWFMQPVLDDIFLKQDEKMLLILPIAVVINAIIKSAATFYQTTQLKIIGQKILTELQLKLYSHLIKADISFLDKYPSGNLISRFTNDISAMRKTVTSTITALVVDSFTIIGLIGVMMYQSMELAFIALVVFPLAFYPLRKLARRMRKVARNMQEELSGFTIRLDETFQNTKVIKSYCRENYEISRARKIINKFLELYRKAAYVESASSPIVEAIGALAVAIIIAYGGSQVIGGDTTPGSFFSFIASLLIMYKPLKTLSNLNTSIQEGVAAARRLFLMIDEAPKIFDTPGVVEQNIKSYNIEYKNIHFSYDRDQKILKGININIEHGKTIALVGSSGSGKSTVFNLLQRFYQPNFGDIKIGGINITDMPIAQLRSKIAIVSQEIALFDDTILENIRYGKLDANEEQIISAAMAAAAHDFIVEMPDGYNTKIGQQGTKLSGGQRQRIAIARAILKDAPILLLDEATSALDTVSEKQIQMAMEFLKQGRTTIVIAHRLSTIEKADLIYYIENGEVTESGTHNELLSLGGCYANLYKKYKDSDNIDANF